MNSEVDYANTYWCEKGKHEALDEKLRKLVPGIGEVENADRNPALERYRVASNCYYDLYNNGLCNMAKEFRKVFGFSGKKLQTAHLGLRGALTQELVDRTESAMDKIILAAAKEQRIGEHTGETIDITPVGLQTPD